MFWAAAGSVRKMHLGWRDDPKMRGYSPAGHIYFGTCLSHMIVANTRNLFLGDI